MTSTSLVKSENLCRNSQHGKINGTSAFGQIPVCNGQVYSFLFLLLAKPQMYSISTVHWSAQEHIICNYCLQTAKKTKNTGGRDLINFKNTHSDKQSPENKSARPILPPSAIPGCVPTADNGCAPLRALYWDDRWGHLPHSRPCLLRPCANVCSLLKRISGNSYKW